MLATALTVWPTTSANAGATQFATYRAPEQPATGTPLPASGAEVVMLSTGSAATTTVSGSGRVVVGATGKYCDAWPVLSVTVDGVSKGTVRPTSTTNYGAYMSTGSVNAGTHQVKITFTNDLYDAGRCDRNAYLASVKMESASATQTSIVSTGKPSAGNTGVPDGVALKAHSGDITVTKDGTVIDGLDVKGAIYIKANNVTVRRTLVRGGPASSKNMALIASWWGNSNTRIEDSTLRADHPSFYLDGLSGSNIAATRLDISRVVDSVKVIRGNVSVTNSWLHSNSHFSPDPTQKDNQSHNDGVQVTGGRKIVITGNTIDGAHNAAIMVGQGKTVGDVKIANNWLSGGGCAVNVTQSGVGTPIAGMSVAGNKFGPGRYATSCPMRLPSASPIALSGNVWESTRKPAVPQRF